MARNSTPLPIKEAKLGALSLMHRLAMLLLLLIAFRARKSPRMTNHPGEKIKNLRANPDDAEHSGAFKQPYAPDADAHRPSEFAQLPGSHKWLVVL